MRPIIYKYYEYEKFLFDWVEFLKSTPSNKNFSLRKLAQMAGISSAYLPLVLSKKRMLSSKMLNKILPFLQLDGDEEIYFELLVQLGNASTQDSKLRYLKLMEANPNFSKYNAHNSEAYKYLAHWYYVAIRELTADPNFQDDPQWIRKKLKGNISVTEIKKALKFLLSRGFIKQDKQGKFLPPDKTINCDDGIYKIVLTEFHKEMFQLGIKSIEETDRNFRNIKGHTFTIPFEEIESAKKIIDQAEQELRKLGNKYKNAEIVMQGQLALFPLTKFKQEKNNNEDN